MGNAQGRQKPVDGRRTVTVAADVFERAEAQAAAAGRTVEELLDSLLRALPQSRAAGGAAAALSRAPTARSISARRSGSGALPAGSGGGGGPGGQQVAIASSGRQGSLLALFVTEPIITLVAGLLKGDHTVSQALAHGDFGLGTLDQLDGEVVVLDGVAYHQGKDGVRVLDGSEPSPFMTVTWFDKPSSKSAAVGPAASFEELQSQLLAIFGGQNCVYAVRISGKLRTLRIRSVCKQPDGTPLVEAAAKQLVFDFVQEEGDLVGFWCPAYSGPGIQVPGFHLHYISADRTRGGHVLQLSLESGTAQWIEVHRCIVDLPSTDAFMHHDLSMDKAREQLHAAEADHS